MPESRLLMEQSLANGLEIRFHDVSRHYFGGYFHLIIEAAIEYPLEKGWFESCAEYENALSKIGSPVRFSRTMERMAVSGEEMESALMQMLDAFRRHVTSYLLRDNFRRGYARSLAAKDSGIKCRPFIPA